MSSVLVIGASRGIGLEFVRQYANDGARVLATHRQPQDGAALRQLGAKPIQLDVLDSAAIAHLATMMGTDKLDIAIINAGVYGPRLNGIAPPSQNDFDSVMRTNVFASMQLIPALAPALIAAGGKLAVISSAMGSISRLSSSAGWLYRASKAALNMALRVASFELGPQGVVCMAFHPGWVQTDMGGAAADIDAATSVSGMRHVIAAANASHSGKFMRYTGEQLQW